MQNNRVKAALKRGEVVFGSTVLHTRNPNIAQIYAACGLDFICLDMEHTSFSLETIADTILVARAAGITPLVGPPAIHDDQITRPLDSGAMGLVIPHVETREQVEFVVQHVKYPPLGQRGLISSGPHTDFTPGISSAEVVDFLNRESLIVLKIESATAIDRLEELVSVEGVDVCFIGPGDLSLSLGMPGQWKHPKEEAYIDKAIDTCRQLGVASGIHVADTASAKQWLDRGMTFIGFSSEVSIIAQGLRSAMSELRSHVGQAAARNT